MRVTIDRGAMLGAVKSVLPAVMKRDIKPVLNNILVRSVVGKVLVTGYDLEIGATKVVAGGTVHEPGSCLLPAESFASVLRECRDESMELLVNNGQIMLMAGKRVNFRFPLTAPETYPEVPSTEEAMLMVGADQLAGMVKHTAYAAAGADSARYAMKGVCWDVVEKKLRLVGTDGRRLAVAEELITETAVWPRPIVPVRAMQMLGDLAEADGGEVGIYFDTSSAYFALERTLLYARLIEGRYPDWKNIVPGRTKIKATVKAGELLTALRQAAVMVDAESQRLSMHFEDNNITLSANSQNAGGSSVDVAAEYSHEPMTVFFMPYYLKDFLATLAPETELTLGINDPSTIVAFTAAGGRRNYYLTPLTERKE